MRRVYVESGGQYDADKMVDYVHTKMENALNLATAACYKARIVKCLLWIFISNINNMTDRLHAACE